MKDFTGKHKENFTTEKRTAIKKTLCLFSEKNYEPVKI